MRQVVMLLSAALAILLTLLLLLLSCNMGREEALAIVLLADDADPSTDVISHLKGFVVKVFRGNAARPLHSKVSRILFKQNDTGLPLIILVKGERLLGVVAGLPSKQLWIKIIRYLSLNNTPFLAFSGPRELLLKCLRCPLYGSLEEIFSIPAHEAKEILRLLKEARLQQHSSRDL
ncbi:MAG: hypothetical protein DRK00_06670 [Thermoprotei archaeon]|nr:MAG: hypothetical protein DRK00_06670 [Thermoprotei archaeon]